MTGAAESRRTLSHSRGIPRGAHEPLLERLSLVRESENAEPRFLERALRGLMDLR